MRINHDARAKDWWAALGELLVVGLIVATILLAAVTWLGLQPWDHPGVPLD